MTDDIRILRIPDKYAALGIAVHFIAKREPFAKFGFGEFAHTLDGQIRRGHYFMAFRGNKVIGYVGYALYTSADAKAFAETGRPPDNPASGGDVLWLLTMVAVDDTIVDGLTRRLSHEYAGHRTMGIRYKADGSRRFFDLKIRDRSRAPR